MGERSQNEGKWDKVQHGESQELSEGKAGQAWVEAGRGPPPPQVQYTHGGGETGRGQGQLVVGVQRMDVRVTEDGRGHPVGALMLLRTQDAQ